VAEFEHKENSGTVFHNIHKVKDTQPDWKGKANIGGEVKDIAMWERTSPKGQYFSIAISEPYVKPDQEQSSSQSGYDKAKQARDSLQDTTDYDSPLDTSSIPF
jgi:hypothetical protein